MSEQPTNRPTKVTLIKRSFPACPGCRMTQLQMDGEGIEYEALDITDQPHLIDEYNLSAVPVLLIEKPGEERVRLDGFQPADVIKSYL